jgi:NADPH:quinone reductase-like Zn-dependent oxidoreductase
MMGFASNKTVADEPFVVPRRVALGNLKLCGVLLNYQADEMVGVIKQAMGWNVAPRALGERATDEIVQLVRSGAVHAVVGSTPRFEELPAALAAMASRGTVGRVVVLT